MSSQTIKKILVAIFVLEFSIDLIDSVIVDGNKKPEVSATTKQSDEKSSVDSFNTKTCGIYDANFREHEFVNMAREGQFPWIVSFQIKVLQNSSSKLEQEIAAKEQKTKTTAKNLENLHFCSGSFISDKWILSAAHCFSPKTIENYLKNNKLIVVAGSHKVSSKESINRNLTIERIYIHSSFDKSMPVGFDIALVELSSPIKITQKREQTSGHQSGPFMNTICLPLRDKKYKFNETARIAGWGLSSEKDMSSMPTKLLTTDILLSKTDDCIKHYVKSLKSDKPKLHKDKYDDVICANYKNSRDACQSDSGGPLMQYSNKRAIIIGIVSYGIGCATKGVPGLYTRTSAYINWIRDITMHGKNAQVPFRIIESNNSVQSNTTSTSNTTIIAETKFIEISTTSTTKAPAERSTTMALKTTTTAMPMSTIVPVLEQSRGFKFFDEV